MDNFKALADNLIDGILVVVGEGQTVFANRHASMLTGYTNAELLAYGFKECVDPAERAKVMDYFERRISGREAPQRYESVFLRKDGGSFPVEVATTRTTWHDQPASMIVFTDITERLEARKRFRENQRAIAALLSNLPGMAYRCREDRFRTMEFVSEGCKALTGYGPAELTGAAAGRFGDLVHPEDRPAVLDAICAALKKREAFKVQYRITNKEGETRWLWEHGRGAFDAGGELLQIEGFVSDITDQKRVEEALRSTEERRRRTEQLAYVGELAARLNHEIKNPLATIRAGLEVLERELVMSRESRYVLDTVVSEVKNVNRLVNDLLNVARSEPLQPRPTSLNAEIREVSEPFFNLARGRGVVLQIEMPKDDIVVVIDSKAFRRFLGNLVLNAFDAVGDKGRITISCRRMRKKELREIFSGTAAEGAAVAVSDTGPGIPPEIQDRIFETFFTTKKTGTGLGLAVARDIIESYGGRLTVSSAPGQETRFEAFLPAVARRLE